MIHRNLSNHVNGCGRAKDYLYRNYDGLELPSWASRGDDKQANVRDACGHCRK